MLSGWILIIAGTLAMIFMVITNVWMNTRKAQRMVKILGVAGAKIFYGIIASAAIIVGVLSLLGIVNLG